MYTILMLHPLISTFQTSMYNMLICNTQKNDAYISGRGGAGLVNSADICMKVSSCKVQSNTFIHKTLLHPL